MAENAQTGVFSHGWKQPKRKAETGSPGKLEQKQTKATKKDWISNHRHRGPGGKKGMGL
jgi:hypothetical protein